MVEERRGTKQTSQVVHVLRLDPPVAFQGQTLEHVRLSLTVKVRRVPAKATVKANADYRELNVVERLVVYYIQMSSSCHIEHSRTENKTAMIKTAKSEPAKKKLLIMEGRKQSKFLENIKVVADGPIAAGKFFFIAGTRNPASTMNSYCINHDLHEPDQQIPPDVAIFLPVPKHWTVAGF
ncbi:60S ribosomal protein L17 [Culex quinquefasciatus]|uniref:60S ribosomal protein L17 n=1 Tax=Culex quinquefasciatus TaxID=7176 RepID=B0X458_CULQU|nr:60S ribosomal protein L17 [Culex quinquefasciatus]|eukprot:XP_001864430.1 60S ribosomal protein L17 [Culex quinquefasciatus]